MSMSGIRIVTQTTLNPVGVGGAAQLHAVNVSTKSASAVITIYNDVAANAGSEIAVIDASALGSYYYGGIVCNKGLTIKQTGGTADVTVSYC